MLIIAALIVVLLLLLSVSLYRPSGPSHFLSYSEDSYKIAFISGNFTAAVTKDMPRVVFSHTTPVLSPEFATSTEKLYLFNDTDHDGLFSKSEAVYTSYLDSHHVQWSISKVEFGPGQTGKDWAQLTVRGNLSLFVSSDDVAATPAVSDWAVIEFQYRISEADTTHVNQLGSYTVSGGSEMNITSTLTILKHMPEKGIAMETYIHGGGSTNMLLLRQGPGNGNGLTNVSSGIDESVIGANFTHRFVETDLPCQEVYMAKEGGIVQAFYRFSSVPTNSSSLGQGIVPMNASYFTDGSGMFLHLAFFPTNGTERISEDSSLGIDQAGFNVTVKDWFQAHYAILMVVVGSMTAVILLIALAVMYRRYRKLPAEGEEPRHEEPKN